MVTKVWPASSKSIPSSAVQSADAWSAAKLLDQVRGFENCQASSLLFRVRPGDFRSAESAD